MQGNAGKRVESYKRAAQSAGGFKHVDSHLHTYFSDGLLSPEEVVGAAKEAGRKAVVITDHNTVSGIPRAVAEGKRLGLPVVPGIEITAFDEETGKKVHIKGMGINPNYAPLREYFGELKKIQARRAERIAQNLRGLGFAIDRKFAITPWPAKLYSTVDIARLLLENEGNKALFRERYGKPASFENVFRTLLSRTAPAYEDWEKKITAKNAIELIRNAGGIADLAHPGHSRLKGTEIARFQKYGLQSIEAYHHKHSKTEKKYYKLVAATLGLGVSSGTDFHGESE